MLENEMMTARARKAADGGLLADVEMKERRQSECVSRKDLSKKSHVREREDEEIMLASESITITLNHERYIHLSLNIHTYKGKLKFNYK